MRKILSNNRKILMKNEKATCVTICEIRFFGSTLVLSGKENPLHSGKGEEDDIKMEHMTLTISQFQRFVNR